jgi:hypothetical protein
METRKSSVFFGGIPTEPDVNKLLEEINVKEMKPGETVPYSDVGIVIGQRVGTSRWRSVTNAWRKRLEKDYNIIIGCKSFEKAFCILTEGGKVNLSGRKLRSAVTMARRSYKISGYVDVKKLTEAEKKDYEHFTLKSANILATAQLRGGKNLLPEMTEK